MSLLNGPSAPTSQSCWHHNSAQCKCQVTVNWGTAQQHQCGQVAAVNCDNHICVQHCSYAPYCQIHLCSPSEVAIDTEDIQVWLWDTREILTEVDLANIQEHQDIWNMVLPMSSPTSQQIAAWEAMEISTALAASLEPTGTNFSTNSYNSATHQPSLNYPSSSSLILPPNESTPFSAVTKSTATTTFHSDATSALIPALPNSFPSLVETSTDRAWAQAPPQPNHDPRNTPVLTLDWNTQAIWINQQAYIEMHWKGLNSLMQTAQIPCSQLEFIWRNPKNQLPLTPRHITNR